jgi:hypothetical protein
MTEQPYPGFLLHIELRPGFTAGAARELERRLEAYAEAHHLELRGHVLTRVVAAEDRGLTATDQVDLLDWLIDQSGINVVRISTLSAGLDSATAHAHWQAGFTQFSACDMGLIGLTILYRARRITAELYLQILGGFQRPAAAH